MESYIEEGLKQFNKEVEQKILRLIEDIEPHMTDLLRDTINTNIKQSTEMFLNSPEKTATKLDNEITKIRQEYDDMPQLRELSLQAIEDQFKSLLVAHRNNLDSYVSGIKRQLLK
jgi:hypothetical protein